MHQPRFDGLVNFRDLGGHRTVGGATTRHGRIFRSDSVHKATADDIDRLLDLGVRRVVDLRTDHERETDGTAHGRHGDIEVHSVALLDSTVPHEAGEQIDLGTIYLHILRNRGKVLIEAVRLLVTVDGAAVFQCTAGKDRTGVVAAVILSAVGVPDEHIVADYERSAKAMPALIAWYRANLPDAPIVTRADAADASGRMLTASAEFMLPFLAALRDEYGSAERYLLDNGLEAPDLHSLRLRLADV
jgi:protein-tyrosine phosphatase